MDFDFLGVGVVLFFAAFCSIYVSCILCDTSFLAFP